MNSKVWKLVYCPDNAFRGIFEKYLDKQNKRKQDTKIKKI
ncbi:MAG: hypothetical protein G01um101466_347 [Parcubacteria group bacterium Gr01-1014_66]|nr:MAG: hypothetical protein G01um101466_347 [Parcubacteria group bacterium Gr01-1014_66]